MKERIAKRDYWASTNDSWASYTDLQWWSIWRKNGRSHLECKLKVKREKRRRERGRSTPILYTCILHINGGTRSLPNLFSRSKRGKQGVQVTQCRFRVTKAKPAFCFRVPSPPPLQWKEGYRETIFSLFECSIPKSNYTKQHRKRWPKSVPKED